MDVDPSSPFSETGDDANARSNSPAMETDDTTTSTTADASLQNVLAPRNPNSEESPLTSAQIQVQFCWKRNEILWLFIQLQTYTRTPQQGISSEQLNALLPKYFILGL